MQAKIGDYILTKSMARLVTDVDRSWMHYVFSDETTLSFLALDDYPDSYAILSEGRLYYEGRGGPPEWATNWVNKLNPQKEKEMSAKAYEKQILVFGNNVKTCSVESLKNLLKQINKALNELEEIYEDAPVFADKEASKLEKAKEAVCYELNKR